jgi:branched-chain amino acid transport system permease protein
MRGIVQYLHTRLSTGRVAIFSVICLTVFPVFVQDPYILNVILISLLYSVLSLSWNFISGYTGIFTLGHQGFFGIGAYFSALLAMKAGISPWFGLLIGGIIPAILGFLIGLPCLRLRAAPYIALTTLGFSEIVRIICNNLVNLTRGELGLWGIPTFPDVALPGIGVITFTGGARIPYYYLVLIIFVITIVVLHLSINSPIGLALRSIHDSQEAAESLGINITYYKLLAFVVSAFFSGVVGSFYAHYLLILTPTSVFSVGLMVEILAFTMVGGLGTFLGPVFGSFLLTLGLEFLRFLGEYRFITYGILLVLITLFMPEGLWKKLFREKGVH